MLAHRGHIIIKCLISFHSVQYIVQNKSLFKILEAHILVSLDNYTYLDLDLRVDMWLVKNMKSNFK